MPSETRYILTSKGHRLRHITWGKGPGVSHRALHSVSLPIVALLKESGSMTQEELESELVGEFSYWDIEEERSKQDEISPSDVRNSIREMFEAGYIEKVD